MKRFEESEAFELPKDFNYIGMPGLSAEEADKLQRTQPASVHAAGKIQGQHDFAFVRLPLTVML